MRLVLVQVGIICADLNRQLQKRQISGARECAEATALLLRKSIESFEDEDPNKLIIDIKCVATRLIAAQPRELTITNIVRRVLGIIRDELEQTGKTTLQSQDYEVIVPPQEMSNTGESRQTSSLKGDTSDGQLSMFNLLSDSKQSDSTPMASIRSAPPSLLQQPRLSENASVSVKLDPDSKLEVIGGMEELLDEIRQADDQIAAYSTEQIHSREIILTNTLSAGVQKFLVKAAQRRRFSVILVEGYPSSHRTIHEGANGKQSNERNVSTHSQKTLTSHGVHITVVPDSACFGLMARVSKVILDARLVLANGSMICASGSQAIAVAAKQFQVPVLVLSAVYQISPEFPFDINRFFDSARGVDLPVPDNKARHRIETQNPLYDHVPARLLDLYITNLGGNAPPSLHRLINDHYRQEDRGPGNPF